MMLISSLWRSSIFGVALTTLSLICNASATAKPRIEPLRATATFSSQSPQSPWSVPIKSPDGTTAYVLSLEPDFDVGHHVVTLELVLRKPGGSTDAPNLLDPTGKSHGLQAYDFAANDLARGVQKSAFGESRTVHVQNLGLMLQITISKAAVSPISTDSYQVDGLELQIEVENRKP